MRLILEHRDLGKAEARDQEARGPETAEQPLTEDIGDEVLEVNRVL